MFVGTAFYENGHTFLRKLFSDSLTVLPKTKPKKRLALLKRCKPSPDKDFNL
jgi:hypothetical protein